MYNKDNYTYFNQPDEADNWVWRVENGVGDWIRKMGDKSLWYIVLWESKRQGTLKKDVTREQFATLLMQECAEALSENDTVKKVFHNIESFKYKSDLKRFDRLMDTHMVRGWVERVSKLLTCDVPVETFPEDFSLEQRMEEFLNDPIAGNSLTKVCIHPVYNGKTATMSVENYVSQRFMDEHRPSHTTIFECVEEQLTEEKVEMISGRFGGLKNTKVFIASTHSFSGSVKVEAGNHDIGLVLVDPRRKVTGDCFVLPRSEGSQPSDEHLWMRMLLGKEKMTVPILVYDRLRIDDSLSFVLYKYASCDMEKLFAAAPMLSDAYIEAEALKLVQKQVELYEWRLSRTGLYDPVPVCEIDPYMLARELGLDVKRGKTGRNLGLIDISHKQVTLSNRLNHREPRDRFSMAHEIGHKVLHSQVIETVEKDHKHIVPYNKQWLEHHAQYFASCLLMPAPLARRLYELYWKKEFKRGEVGPITVDGADYYHDQVFQRVVGPVARKMNVSLQVAYIRLSKMGLIRTK